jgi:hypothetical protein
MDLEILSGLAGMADDNGDMSGSMMGDMMGIDSFNYLAGDDDDYLDDIAGVNPELAMMMGWSPWGAAKAALDPRTPFRLLTKGGRKNIAQAIRGKQKAQAMAKGMALMQNRAQQQAALAQSAYAQPQPLSMVQPQIAGVPDRGGRVQPLGFENGAFTAAGPAVVTIRARPQRPLRGGRLVADFTRTGATATGLLTLVQLVVATDGQLLSGDPISFAALSPNAFGVGVNLSPAAVGNEIFATVAISALPTMTDRVDFNLTLFGLTVG